MAQSPEETTGGLPPNLEAHKRQLYESMKPRRRKFVDKIGYENWDPLAPPKDPIEIRTDPTQHTAQELATKFLRSRPQHKGYSQQYAQGVMECAVGMINGHDKYEGAADFAVWYNEFKKQQGHDNG